MLNLAAEPDLHPLAGLVQEIRTAAPDADLLLVGAMARDVLLLHAHGIDTRRATEDVDIALTIDNWAAFSALREKLIQSGKFVSVSGVLHKLRSESLSIKVDLIPFGGVENVRGEIVWPPENAEVMRVIGYRESRDSAIHVNLPLEQSINVVSLPMFALLKLFAWVERHYTAPRKDAIDIETVLKNYLGEANLERLYTEAPLHFSSTTYEYDHEISGAWLCGHDVRQTLAQHSARGAEVMTLANAALEQEMNADGPLILVSQAKSENPEHLRKLLAAFHAGLNLKATP